MLFRLRLRMSQQIITKMVAEEPTQAEKKKFLKYYTPALIALAIAIGVFFLMLGIIIGLLLPT